MTEAKNIFVDITFNYKRKLQKKKKKLIANDIPFDMEMKKYVDPRH